MSVVDVLNTSKMRQVVIKCDTLSQNPLHNDHTHSHIIGLMLKLPFYVVMNVTINVKMLRNSFICHTKQVVVSENCRCNNW